MFRISNDYFLFFSFSLSLFFSSFCPCSLNIIRSRHIRIPVVLIRHCPSLPRSTPSLVDCQRVAVTRRRTPIRYILQLSRCSTSIVQTSFRILTSRFRPSSALCWSDFLFLLSLYFFLSFYPPSFSISSRHRQIITREPEFHFALIERSARRCAGRMRASTFPSLDARRVSHDSLRVSGYSERKDGE